MKDKLYFVGLKAFIVNEKGELLILQGGSSMEKEGLWGLPGGRIMEGEEEVALQNILLREINEECGDIEVVIGIPFCTWRFHIETKSVFLVGYAAKYICGEISLSEEHVSYKWIGVNEVEGVPFVDGYKEVVTDFFKKRNLLE